MNKLKYYFGFIVCTFLILNFNSCKEQEDLLDIKTTAYQIAGCQGTRLSKTAEIDSCFSYSFNENLILDFCAAGNCCPDKNRFLIDSKFIRDTIAITIVDTAHNLCRCNCNYIIHTEFQNLSINKYVVKCVEEESFQKTLLYLKEVRRN